MVHFPPVHRVDANPEIQSFSVEGQRCGANGELLLESRHFSCARADDEFVMGSGQGLTVSTPPQALTTAHHYRQDEDRRDTVTVLLVGPGSGET